MSTLTLTVKDSNELIRVESSSLLVFIDETGEEMFSDPQHAVFGLGGCAVLAGEYNRVIASPWREMKDRFFFGANNPLHANELISPTSDQINALVDFFACTGFSRMAATASKKGSFLKQLPSYDFVARTLLARIEKVAQIYRFSRLVFFLESSTRTDSKAKRCFGPYDSVRIEENGQIQDVSIDHFFLPKGLNELGLEVADFIMHAVGGQVRTRLTNRNAPFRKDFAAVFHSVPQ
jgi:hypothetical protein